MSIKLANLEQTFLLVTLKHDALDAKINVNLLDINHYSEYVMKEGLKELLAKWLFKYENQFPIYASEINTDPFKYK